MSLQFVLFALLAALLGLVTTVDASECKEDDKHYCVNIKCAAGAGYVLLVEWLGLGSLNPKPEGKHRGYDVHEEEVMGTLGYLEKHMKVVRLSVGQGVNNIKVVKDFEFVFHASWGGFTRMKATKSGQIDCTGLSGSPKCEYRK